MAGDGDRKKAEKSMRVRRRDIFYYRIPAMEGCKRDFAFCRGRRPFLEDGKVLYHYAEAKPKMFDDDGEGELPLPVIFL